MSFSELLVLAAALQVPSLFTHPSGVCFLLRRAERPSPGVGLQIFLFF